MEFSKLLISFVFLGILIVIECRVFEDRQIREIGDGNGLIIRDSGPLHREKRGLFSFFVTASLSAFSLASSGLSLAQAVSEGCTLLPNICKHKDAIEKMEKQLDELGGKYDAIFRENQWKYLNLRTTMIDNAWILRKTDDQINLVEDLGTRIEIITRKLELDLETMTKMFAESNDTQNTANVFEKLIGPLEYQLEDIVENIKSMKHSYIKGLVIQKSVEVFLQVAVKYAKRIVKEAKMTVDADDNIFNRISSSENDLPEQKKSFWRKTKYFFQTKAKRFGYTLKAIGKDIKKKFRTTLPNNVKKWMEASRKWSTFKLQFATSFLNENSKIGKIKSYFKSPIIKTKIAVKNYKFNRGSAFIKVMNIAANTINLMISQKMWNEVEENLLKAKTEYEDYIEKAKTELTELDNEALILDQYWSNTISSFQDLVKNFTNITETARENTLFSDIVGLTGIPVDTSDPFFHTDFTQVTQKNIKPKQKIVIDFFNANGKNLSVLRDKFRVQQVLVSETKNRVLQQEPVSSIFDNLVRFYKNYDTQVLVEYSSRLVPRDVVCSTSMIFPNITEYDCYPLNIFRSTKCNITDLKFANIEQQAANKRDAKILQQTIKDHVPKNAKPSSILDLAKGVYAASKEQSLKEYGNGLKEKDVVCEISVLYPDLNTYMLYDLTRFRSDCAQVSDFQFQQMKADIVKMETAKSILNILMKVCLVTTKPCDCPSDMVLVMQITVDQVLTLIDDYKQEHKPNCEFIVGNTSCNWSCPLTTPII